MGLLSAFSAKISAMRQRSKDKKEFFENLVRAASDGKLTDEESGELQSQYKQLQLTEDDLRTVRVQVYEVALRTARADAQISSAEEAELDRLQRFFKIPDADISKSKRELTRLGLLTEIQNYDRRIQRRTTEERDCLLDRAREPLRGTGRARAPSVALIRGAAG